MARTLVTLLMTLVAIAFAASPSAARPRFGVVALPQLTEFVPRSHEPGTPDVKWSWTGSGGLLAELPLPGRFSLATGVEYGEHADDQSTALLVTSAYTTTWTIEARRELRVRTAALPVRIEWRPGRWLLGAGPEVRCLVSADERLSLSTPVIVTGASGVAAARGRSAGPAAVIFENVGLDRWFDATDQFRRWSLAAQFAVGREMPVGAHVLRADLRWSEGITHQQWYPQITQRTRAAQLAIGFLW